MLCIVFRVVGRSENPGVPVLFGGLNLPPSPMIEIGLTNLQKSEGAMATLAPPSSDGHAVVVLLFCYGLAAANKDSNIVLGLTF